MLPSGDTSLLLSIWSPPINADHLSEDVFHNIPLHYAAALGYLDIVQFLVNIGSPLTTRGVWDKTPAEMAAAGGHSNVLDYFRSISLLYDKPLITMIHIVHVFFSAHV